jgi:hypothetical protein
MLTEYARLSRDADIAKAMDYMLKCWPTLQSAANGALAKLYSHYGLPA